MKSSPRRALSTILAAALFLGSMPQGASAQVARVVVGETGGMPVTPIAGMSGGMTLAPALSLGAATLNGTLSAPSSPLPTESGRGTSSPYGSVVTIVPAAVAPVSVPVALTAAVSAVAAKEDPKL